LALERKTSRGGHYSANQNYYAELPYESHRLCGYGGDLLAMADIGRRHDLIVVSDESYDNTAYDRARHIRVASVRGLRDRTITICSFTEGIYLTPDGRWYVSAAHTQAGHHPGHRHGSKSIRPA
jgi:hypothetical protein